MRKKEYFKCANCGQVVQGWNASQTIKCCKRPRYAPVDANNEQHAGRRHRY